MNNSGNENFPYASATAPDNSLRKALKKRKKREKQKKQKLIKKELKASVKNHSNFHVKSHKHYHNQRGENIFQKYFNMNLHKYKQELAYFKSKTIALEYENKVLHDIIKRLSIQNSENQPHIENTENSSSSESDETSSISTLQTHNTCRTQYVNEDQDDTSDEEEMEISEEFVQFLVQNEKYRKEARKEKEALRQNNEKQENLVDEMELPPKPDTTKSNEEHLKKFQDLYGHKWTKIVGLHEDDTESQHLEDVTNISLSSTSTPSTSQQLIDPNGIKESMLVDQNLALLEPSSSGHRST